MKTVVVLCVVVLVSGCCSTIPIKRSMELTGFRVENYRGIDVALVSFHDPDLEGDVNRIFVYAPDRTLIFEIWQGKLGEWFVSDWNGNVESMGKLNDIKLPRKTEGRVES